MESYMKYGEAEEFMKGIYPDDQVEFVCDKDCMSYFKLDFNNNIPSIYCLVFYDKMKVLINGQYKHLIPLDIFSVQMPTQGVMKDVLELLERNGLSQREPA